MSKPDIAERIATEAAQGGKIIAYQLGALYPKFEGADRKELAEIFERHGFPRAAASVLDIDLDRALNEASGRIGGRRKDGLKVDKLEADTDAAHVRAWGIYRVVRQRGERGAQFALGARVYSTKESIHYAPPLEGSSDPECVKLADELLAKAQWLATNADTSAVSIALGQAIEEAGAYGFISRGSYVVRAGRVGTDRILACFKELRGRFYDETRRSGLRCSVVAITAHDQQALSDSVIDDAEVQVAELVAQLRLEAGSTSVRVTTLARRRQECVSLLDKLRPLRELIGTFSGRLEGIVTGVAKAYNEADEAVNLEVPEFLLGDGAPPEGELESAPESGPAEAAPESAPASAPAPEAPLDDLFAL